MKNYRKWAARNNMQLYRSIYVAWTMPRLSCWQLPARMLYYNVSYRPILYTSYMLHSYITEWPKASLYWNLKQKATPAIAEKADRTALSRIAVQHADDGYSRRGIFGGSVVHSKRFVFARWHQRLWFKTWGVWGDRVVVGVESCTRRLCCRKDNRAMRPI